MGRWQEIELLQAEVWTEAVCFVGTQEADLRDRHPDRGVLGKNGVYLCAEHRWEVSATWTLMKGP